MCKIWMRSCKGNGMVRVMVISGFVCMVNESILKSGVGGMMKGVKMRETTGEWLIRGFMVVKGIMIGVSGFLMDKYWRGDLYIL